ncbi:MAG: hypothetical protein HGA80_04120 [Candidatus Omnitrophica bacterium]|nr:hypothetical protein [Candidatus Omnitrophota bacterium]
MRPAPQPVAQPTTNANPPAPASGRPNQQPRARLMHQAVCAECKKECEVPFKPSGDRPVYCQECFTRRKSANKTKVEPEPKPVEEPPLPSVIDAAIDIPETPARDKKKPAARKPATRKKPVVKKKK